MKFLRQLFLSCCGKFQMSESQEQARLTAEELGGTDAFRDEFSRFKAMHEGQNRREPIEWNDRYPCLQDKTIETPFDRHYLYHPAWAARVLARTKPDLHVDFSSSLAFCTIVSAFVPVRFYDYRPAPIVLSDLKCEQANLTALSFGDASFSSISCMHVIEHIGLARYGDPLDPMGDIKALNELARIVKPGGDLLIAVPVGRARVQFNAHRIYDHRQFAGYLPGMELMEFCVIPDDPASDGYIANPSDEFVRQQKYACGCYWFRKT